MDNDQFNLISNNDAMIIKVIFSSDYAIIDIETWDNKNYEINCSSIHGIKNNANLEVEIGDIKFSRETDFYCETAKALFGGVENVPASVRSMIICEAYDNTPILEVVAESFELTRQENSSCDVTV